MGLHEEGGTGFPSPLHETSLRTETARRFVTVSIASGMALRAAAIFAETASDFSCQIRIRNSHMVVDGKGVLSVLSLGADTGTLLEITAHGPGATLALDVLAGLTTTEGMNLFSAVQPGNAGTRPIDGNSAHKRRL